MAQTVTLRAAGLYLQPNDIGEVPEGALSQADDVVISRDGIIEPRRGSTVPSTLAGCDRLFPYAGALIGHAGSSIFRSDAGVATWTAYGGTFTAGPGGKVRFAVANKNLYAATGQGIQRLDSLTGTFEPAGMPPGLDMQLSLAGAGAAMPTASMLGYRVIWGKRDANKNQILGAPSGRATISNSGGSTQNVSVAFSVPRSLPSGAFYQAYRTVPSVSATTDPGDEMGLVYEGTAPLVSAVTQLSRATGVVTATTTAPHGYATGHVVRVSPGGLAAGHEVAIGSSGAIVRSTDHGATWSAAGITGLPASTYLALGNNGSIYVAFGWNGSTAALATSPDGLTWTSRTAPGSIGAAVAVVWTGARFVALGGNSFSTSTDGITWSTGASIFGPSDNWTDLVWTGSQLVAIGSPGATALSPDGITWSAGGTIPNTGGTISSGAWDGSTLVATGVKFGGTDGAIYRSTDSGATWSLWQQFTGSGPITALAWSGTAFTALGNGKSYYSSAGAWSGPNTLSGSWDSVVWDGTNFIAVGTNVAATGNAAGTSWTTRTIAAGTYNALAGGGLYFPAGEKTVTGTPTGTTFTYAEAGLDGTLVQAQTATPLTAGFVDSVATGGLGPALYTNETQGGITAAAYMVGGASDVAVYRGSLFFANVTQAAATDLWLLSVGGTGGVQSGDQIVIDGLAYTAGASENVLARQFQVFTAGTAAQNVQQTAASLIRVINRTASAPIYAMDISSAFDPPGHLRIWESSATAQQTISFVGHASAWSIDSQTPQGQALNVLAWSEQLEPDAVPLVNFQAIGTADKAILRIVPTRDSLFIFKEDGLWRLTGDAPPWNIQPFDPTCILRAPETAVMMNNVVLALANKGVVAVSDTSVEIISRPIDVALLPLLGPSVVATTQAVSFAVAYENARKFYLWLPSSSSDTNATQAFVYDLNTGAWTRDTRAATHGIVNPVDDRLYLASSGNILQERKGFADSDFADPASAINCAIAWTPRCGNSPGTKHHFTILSLAFRRISSASLTLGYTSDLATAQGTCAITTASYGTPPFAPWTVRTWVPLEQSRASLLSISLAAPVNQTTFQLQGMTLSYRPTSEEAGG